MARVIIGVDPHKRSATIEIINAREKTVGQGRFGTDRDGYQAMLSDADATSPPTGTSVPCTRPGRWREQVRT
ncbi:hypothetical protein ACIBTZ_30215 [Micromonospora sp. NPDC049460]|uniref:hypothetical protein n=1 Tax=Micromonospora sp. NPDC049460 TaxID=3364272 RepID=UPI003793AAA6